jgi:hypothetical protein
LSTSDGDHPQDTADKREQREREQDKQDKYDNPFPQAPRFFLSNLQLMQTCSGRPMGFTSFPTPYNDHNDNRHNEHRQAGNAGKDDKLTQSDIGNGKHVDLPTQ